MSNINDGRAYSLGMELVEWYISFVSIARPNSWTFENVIDSVIRKFLAERGIAHGYFNLWKYGVPQTRSRCFAGTSHIIHAFKTNAQLIVDKPQTPRDVLVPPHNAVFIRASGGKNISYFHRSLDVPTWAILTSNKPIYTDSNMSRLRYLNVSEIMALQTFPEWYRIVSEKAMPGTQQDKVLNVLRTLSLKSLR
jgi:hypothetical protein